MNKQELAGTASAMVASGKGLDANKKVAQEALLYRAKCNRAAREGKYSEKMEMGAPALAGAEVQHSHLASQD